MAYTLHDTPDLVARIERDLESVRSTVVAGDPNLRSLILTGGFARGEGTVKDGVPQNDYDFVAVRRPGRPKVPYSRMSVDLTAQLGLHIDLAPVATWRLRWVAPTIFWYETALRGRVLWGDAILQRIGVRDAKALERTESLRMLVNRAAGLLLVTGDPDPHARRIQAAKALLAAGDAHLLSRGAFPPSQSERWSYLEPLLKDPSAPPALRRLAQWHSWAYHFKVEPDYVETVDPLDAWVAARHAILEATPIAVMHAGFNSLDEYGQHDGLIDHLVFWRRASKVPGARPFVFNPTGQVRVATLRLLKESQDAVIPPEAGDHFFSNIARPGAEPLGLLDGLRKATLQ